MYNFSKMSDEMVSKVFNPVTYRSKIARIISTHTQCLTPFPDTLFTCMSETASHCFSRFKERSCDHTLVCNLCSHPPLLILLSTGEDVGEHSTEVWSWEPQANMELFWLPCCHVSLGRDETHKPLPQLGVSLPATGY